MKPIRVKISSVRPLSREDFFDKAYMSMNRENQIRMAAIRNVRLETYLLMRFSWSDVR